MHAINRSIMLSLFCALSAEDVGATDFFGPTAYAQRSDTPAAFLIDRLHLEDFEDSQIDPGLIINGASVIGPSSLTDSVDADDGLLDGSGTNGHSLFAGVPIRVEFAEPVTEAALVWTDGGGSTQVTFEAFDAQGASLGSHGPFTLGDGSNSGTTGEDRFFGVMDSDGITAIEIRHTSGGYEIDHIQWLANAVFKDEFED